MAGASITRSLQVARETVEQGVMLASGHTANLLVLIDDLEARLGVLERAATRALGSPPELAPMATRAAATETD